MVVRRSFAIGGNIDLVNKLTEWDWGIYWSIPFWWGIPSWKVNFWVAKFGSFKECFASQLQTVLKSQIIGTKKHKTYSRGTIGHVHVGIYFVLENDIACGTDGWRDLWKWWTWIIEEMILALAEQFKQLSHVCNLKLFRCRNGIWTLDLCISVLSLTQLWNHSDHCRSICWVHVLLELSSKCEDQLKQHFDLMRSEWLHSWVVN